MYPVDGRKKNCTPRLACSSVSTVGADGSAAATPSAGELNTTPVASSTTFVATPWPVLGRSGVLLYTYPLCIVKRSTQPPSRPPSKSYTLKLMRLCSGRTSVWFISSQPYRLRLRS
jgi:hypothetical protein